MNAPAPQPRYTNAQAPSRPPPSSPGTAGPRPSLTGPAPAISRPLPPPSPPCPPCLAPWAARRPFPRRSGDVRCSLERSQARPCTAPRPPGRAGRVTGGGGRHQAPPTNGCGARRQNLIVVAVGERLRTAVSEWGTRTRDRLWTGVSERGSGTGEGSGAARG